jgi:hypothetical protein
VEPCCSGKAISITYSECVFIALVTWHAMCMRNIAMWPDQLYNIFLHCIITARISGGGVSGSDDDFVNIKIGRHRIVLNVIYWHHPVLGVYEVKINNKNTNSVPSSIFCNL